MKSITYEMKMKNRKMKAISQEIELKNSHRGFIW
jgi:hypothetical protein